MQRSPIRHIDCDVCGKSVDLIMVSQRVDATTLEVQVWCHGTTEICHIPHDLMAELGPDGAMQFHHGVAFVADAAGNKIQQMRQINAA